MGRKPRIHIPGLIHHAMARGNAGQTIFNSPEEFLEFKRALILTKRTTDIEVYSYCLMPNHFHIVLRVGEVSLSRFMQRVLTRWSKHFNFSHRRTGHVFQARFKSLLCVDDNYLKCLLRYIHLNPVKAGLVKRPEDWSWSSFREYVGTEPADLTHIDWPLSFFDAEKERAIQLFREFTLGAEGAPIDMDALLKKSDQNNIEHVLIKNSRTHMIDITNEVSAQTAVDIKVILGTSRSTPASAARRLLVARATNHGYSVTELSRYLSLTSSAICSMLKQSTALSSP